MAQVDLVVRGGTLAGGSGAELRQADFAADGGRIVAVGKFDTTGREELDARGFSSRRASSTCTPTVTLI